MGINYYEGAKSFDPYPFILLNLVLSFTAGIQAPIIMISQNRQEEIQKQTLTTILHIAEASRAMLHEHKTHLQLIHEYEQARIKQMDAHDSKVDARIEALRKALNPNQ